MKNRKSKWLSGIELSLKANLVLTVLLSFVFSFTVFSGSHDHYYQYVLDFLTMFFGLIFYVGLGSTVITLIGVGIFGAPIVYILKELGVGSSINAAVVGSVIVAILMFVSAGKLEWYFLFYSFYGFICGYAFMHGYKKGEKYGKI